MVKIRDASSRVRDVLLGIVCVGFVLGPLIVIWLLGRVDDAQTHAKSAEKEAGAASSAAVANQQALKSANACIRVSCGVPVPTPSPIAGARGERGPGPTSSQIDLAVAEYCAIRNGCVGTPSRADVAAAVRAYCAAGVCRGSTGSRGAQGPAGASGASGAAGATGPGPTEDQISSAVAAYCVSHGNCTGPAGPKGDTGDRGATGRGISSVDCTGLGIDRLTVHYDDGTSQAIPCDTPTPTPSGAPAS